MFKGCCYLIFAIAIHTVWVFNLEASVESDKLKSDKDTPLHDLAIANVTLISPGLGEPRSNVTVYVSGNTISAIEDSSVFLSARRIIDGEGKFLMPGLIDSHVHLYHAPGLKPRYTEDFDNLYNVYLDQMPRSFLYHGFTTVIETNADFESVERFENTPQHPDLIHCGTGLILSDGYMASEIPPGQLLQHAPNFLHDRFANGYLPLGADSESHTPAATVERIARSGARCVKTYYEEAIWMPGGAPEIALPSAEIIKEVIAEAEKRGMTTILHATSPAGHEFGSAVGVGVISHGPWDWVGNNYADPKIPEEVRRAIVQLSSSDAYWQPTFTSLFHTASMFNPGFTNSEEIEDVVPSEYVSYLRSSAMAQKDIFLRIFGEAIAAPGDEDAVSAALTIMLQRYQRIIQLGMESGVSLILGTDTSSGGFGWGSIAGLSGFREMLVWQEIGVPPEQIIAAATIDNARAFGLEEDIGSIGVGKKANLLLLNSNPVDDIAALGDISKVILRGEVIERDQLRAR